MTSPDGRSGPRFPIDPATQRWGLGDVAAGILASLVLMIVLGGLIVAAGGWSDDVDSIPMWGRALLQLPLWGGYLGVLVVASRTKGTGVARDFGVASTAGDAVVGLVTGVAAQLFLLPLVYIPILELTGTTSEDLSAPAKDLAATAEGTLGWVVFALIVGVGAPIVEELFYRGLFLRSLQKRRMPGGLAVVVSSLVFAAVHLQALQFPGLFLFGLIAGALALSTGRLGAAVWAHVGFNLTTVAVLYLDLGAG